MSALLDSVPLAASLAEARREMPEDLDVEPLDLEALEGDEQGKIISIRRSVFEENLKILCCDHVKTCKKI